MNKFVQDKTDRFPELVSQEEILSITREMAKNRDAPATIQKSFFVRSNASEACVKPNVSEVRVTTLNVQNLHNHGELFSNYLKARHDTFIKQRGWDLPETEGMEFDQYDTPLARWIVLHEYGQVLAGIRLIPTTARCGTYTYMLKDAQLGLLKDIPRDVLFLDAPVENHIWEATRLFVSRRVSSERRIQIQTILMQQMSIVARDLGVSYVIGIVPAVFHRWMARIGMSAFPVGPVIEIADDRIQAAMMDVRGSEVRMNNMATLCQNRPA